MLRAGWCAAGLLVLGSGSPAWADNGQTSSFLCEINLKDFGLDLNNAPGLQGGSLFTTQSTKTCTPTTAAATKILIVCTKRFAWTGSEVNLLGANCQVDGTPCSRGSKLNAGKIALIINEPAEDGTYLATLRCQWDQ